MTTGSWGFPVSRGARRQIRDLGREAAGTMGGQSVGLATEDLWAPGRAPGEGWREDRSGCGEPATSLATSPLKGGVRELGEGSSGPGFTSTVLQRSDTRHGEQRPLRSLCLPMPEAKPGGNDRGRS